MVFRLECLGAMIDELMCGGPTKIYGVRCISEGPGSGRGFRDWGVQSNLAIRTLGLEGWSVGVFSIQDNREQTGLSAFS